MANVEFIPGPSATSVSREDAEAGLVRIAKKRGAESYAIEQMGGRWVAALVTADSPFGGPSDQDEESPAPKGDGPAESTPAPFGDDADTGEDTGDDAPEGLDDSEGPDTDADKKDLKEDKKEGHELKQLTDLLHSIADFLGVPTHGAEDSPVPGPDGDVPPPPGPPGAGGPPGGPAPSVDPEGKEHIVHERALKPGETPPGAAPVGAPAFASVREDHPWAHLAGKTASFRAALPLDDNTSIVEATKQAAALADEIGYNHKVTESVDDNGNRIAVALISTHPVD